MAKVLDFTFHSTGVLMGQDVVLLKVVALPLLFPLGACVVFQIFLFCALLLAHDVA
jgi:hypothetical protein